jgi:enoyl-CoA hydratase
MDLETVQTERRGAAAWVRLARPKALNAISPAVVRDLAAAFAGVRDDPAVRAVVLTGDGPAFCAGADLSFALDSLERGETAPFLAFVEDLAEVVRTITRFPKPVIACVNGTACAGGLELVLACDLVYAADSARIGDAHANYGLIPGAGGAARLPSRIGSQRAKELLFTGEFVPASALVAAGLVNRVFPATDLETEVQRIADTIASKSPLGLRRMKEVADDSLEQSDDGALRLERTALAAHLGSEDVRVGLKAFREKRKPEFPGR